MKTLYRQDGSVVELDDADAAKWIKAGLATEVNPVAPEPAPAKASKFNVFPKGE